jgi:hypothetical protein
MHSVILESIMMLLQVLVIISLHAAVIWGVNEEEEEGVQANNGQVILLCLIFKHYTMSFT